MAVSMLDNLSIKKKAPNVDRDLFKTLAEMAAYSENYLPDIFECNVIEDGKRYRFNRNNSSIPTYGKWREVAENNSQDTEQIIKNKEDIEILNGDITVEGSVDSKTATALSEAKLYTDEQISKMSTAEAIVCDTKPSRSDGVTYYVKDGNSLTTEDSEIWFYYETEGKLLQTIWIDEVETTIVSAGAVDFSEYVSKTYDVTNEFIGDESDTDKIPNLRALQQFEHRIQDKLDKKVTGNSIVDDLLSEDSEAPLSANQGRVLNEYIGKKMDAKIIGEDTSNKFLGTDNEGNVIAKSLDSSIDASSENAVKNKAIAEALDNKVSTKQDPSMKGRVLMVNNEGETIFVSMATAGGNTADLISYTNPMMPDVDNVQAMLDELSNKVLYEDLVITQMSCSAQEVNEYGYEYPDNTLKIMVQTNKPIEEIQSATIEDSQIGTTVLEITHEISYVVNGVVDSPRTFTASITDGKTTATKSITIDFGYYMRWGVGGELEEDYQNFIMNELTDKKLTMSEADISGSYTFDAGSDQYAYFAVSSEHGRHLQTVKINGFNTEIVNKGVFYIPSVVNPNVTYPVIVYRTNRAGLGQFTMTID